MDMVSPSPEFQSAAFVGGEKMVVAYSTVHMSHESKLASMRTNNIHFSHSTGFHEVIPGHHLQLHMNVRHRTYRALFYPPFWIEGGAMYWEMLFWDKKFPTTPKDKIWMLYLRMHRCMRIIFSLNFHLGSMTARECVDLLVGRLGHERTAAEAEVRRSIDGNYRPLYQAGYMLGAL
ncbi:X-Pro dipeptidyl-peptidase [Histoplasma ohiense]|nr:X-Pro dipeptidyl-peptidase [Histoplasma ohiense (nom. inval.)]